MSDIATIRRFRANVKSVEDLMGFDDFLIDYVLIPLRSFRNHLETLGVRPNQRPDRIVQLLETLKRNKSVQPYYEAMYNQSLVLLVSHFGSAVREAFVEAALVGIDKGIADALLDTELKIRVRSVREDPRDIRLLLAEAIADSKDISYQDMGSLDRSFQKYFNVYVDQDAAVNDIIVGQACRHAIVHNGAIVNRRILRQTVRAVPRTLREDLREGQDIRFQRDEVVHVASVMCDYLERLADCLEKECISLAREEATQSLE